MADGKLTLVYWPIFAKNIAPALALELGEFNWEMGPGPGSKGTGNLWAEWLEMKPEQVWAYLPNMVLPDGKRIGSELAILQYLARRQPALAGADDNEFLVSQELLHQAEELHGKFSQKMPTIMAQDKSPEDYKSFMEGADKTTHSSNQGLQVYLAQFEEFFTKVGGAGGKFTKSGNTIGEIKFYAVLKCLLLVKSDALSAYPSLSAFITQFESNPKVLNIVEGREGNGRNMSGQPTQYFIAPP